VNEHGSATIFEPTGVVTFRAGQAGRRVAGLIMEWDVVAKSGGKRFRFPRGSVAWHEDVSRVKLNVQHDWSRVIGFAESITDTSTGIEAVFRLARGEQADEALQLAEDHVLDGLSMEPEILDGRRDPHEPSVIVVDRSRLVGVGLTPHPSMDNARLTGVAFSMSPGVVAGLRAQRAAWRGQKSEDLHKDEHGFAIGHRPDRSFYA